MQIRDGDDENRLDSVRGDQEVDLAVNEVVDGPRKKQTLWAARNRRDHQRIHWNHGGF
ncbi:hypothetical protein Hypma_002985 [Hypsizygus marmoreus]|uniref:Uncharacterized protein n=1 Tax=Hypsizygus marmoreus TaxID=39966 RepID=A0A369J2N2_HYPMA|nr:hypothetical protein Hypma_002985 [Hypsizygus marmoreus]